LFLFPKELSKEDPLAEKSQVEAMKETLEPAVAVKLTASEC